MTTRELIDYLKENGQGSVEGVCVRYVWQWIVDGKPVTRAANSLLKSGKATMTAYRGGRATLSLGGRA